MKKVGAFDAKTHLSEYLRKVEEERESIVIQRYGKDVAVLQPCTMVEKEEKRRKTSEVLDAFKKIREKEATYGANRSVKEMVEEGRKR